MTASNLHTDAQERYGYLLGRLHELVPPPARVVELEGRTVLPGFQDAHLHPFSGGMLAIVCNLHETASADDCLEEIARYAAANPDREWISGDGWSMDFFPGGKPDKERLDNVVSDRPVYLENRDGHTAWVNSRALELAGITAETKHER